MTIYDLMYGNGEWADKIEFKPLLKGLLVLGVGAALGAGIATKTVTPSEAGRILQKCRRF